MDELSGSVLFFFFESVGFVDELDDESCECNMFMMMFIGELLGVFIVVIIFFLLIVSVVFIIEYFIMISWGWMMFEVVLIELEECVVWGEIN